MFQSLSEVEIIFVPVTTVYMANDVIRKMYSSVEILQNCHLRIWEERSNIQYFDSIRKLDFRGHGRSETNFIMKVLLYVDIQDAMVPH